MLGAASLSANKTNTNAKGGVVQRECRLCGAGEETEWHIMDKCRRLDEERDQLWKEMDKNARGDHWRQVPSEEDGAIQEASGRRQRLIHHFGKDRTRKMMVKYFQTNGRNNRDRVEDAASVKRFLNVVHNKFADIGVNLTPARWAKATVDLTRTQETNANAQGFVAVDMQMNAK
jgi:hypothetical protein